MQNTSPRKFGALALSQVRRLDATLAAIFGGAAVAAIGTAILLFNGFVWVLLIYWTLGFALPGIPLALWMFAGRIIWLRMVGRPLSSAMKRWSMVVGAGFILLFLSTAAFPTFWKLGPE